MAKYTSKKTIEKPVTKEAAISYAKKTPVLSLVTNRTKAGNGSGLSIIDKIDFVRKGVTKKFLVKIKERTALDYDELAKVLLVGRATLINKTGNTPFNLALSDRIVGLADLYEYGYDVFGNVENFNEWMVAANHALGGAKPFDLIDTQYGKDEVKHLIGRIDNGILS